MAEILSPNLGEKKEKRKWQVKNGYHVIYAKGDIPFSVANLSDADIDNLIKEHPELKDYFQQSS